MYIIIILFLLITVPFFCKRTTLVQLIIENVVTCFFWNTVYILLHCGVIVQLVLFEHSFAYFVTNIVSLFFIRFYHILNIIYYVLQELCSTGVVDIGDALKAT